MGFPILVWLHLYIESGPWCPTQYSSGPLRTPSRCGTQATSHTSLQWGAMGWWYLEEALLVWSIHVHCGLLVNTGWLAFLCCRSVPVSSPASWGLPATVRTGWLAFLCCRSVPVNSPRPAEVCLPLYVLSGWPSCAAGQCLWTPPASWGLPATVRTGWLAFLCCRSVPVNSPQPAEVCLPLYVLAGWPSCAAGQCLWTPRPAEVCLPLYVLAGWPSCAAGQCLWTPPGQLRSACHCTYCLAGLPVLPVSACELPRPAEVCLPLYVLAGWPSCAAGQCLWTPPASWGLPATVHLPPDRYGAVTLTENTDPCSAPMWSASITSSYHLFIKPLTLTPIKVTFYPAMKNFFCQWTSQTSGHSYHDNHAGTSF